MKFILAQPANLRFQWELEVLLTNLASFGKFEIVLLLTTESFTVPRYLQDNYGVSVFVHRDDRPTYDKDYISGIRAWLWYHYLKEDRSREQETYFYIDSDIIFRKIPDVVKMASEDMWVGSDCDGYIGYDYLITRQKGPEIVDKIAEICGVTVQDIKDTPGAGAQWILVNPTAEYFLDVYNDEVKMFHYFKSITTDIQRWTAEMWAALYNAVRIGKKIITPPEFDFCRPTDDIKMWDMVPILHNAGVTEKDKDMLFYKGKYENKTPFNDDLSFVRKDKASWHYVQAIKKVKS